MQHSNKEQLVLGYPEFSYADLHDPKKLQKLHDLFWKETKQKAPELAESFLSWNESLKAPEQSEILVSLAEHVGTFLVKLFGVEKETQSIKRATEFLQPAFRLKKDFLNIRVFKRFEEPAISDADFSVLHKKVKQMVESFVSDSEDAEVGWAKTILLLVEYDKKLKKEPLTAEEQTQAEKICHSVTGDSLTQKIQTALQWFEDWSVQVYVDKNRRKRIEGWASYVRPKKLEFETLVHTENTSAGALQGPLSHNRYRDGFRLTDPRMTVKEFLREIDYCLYCHQREKDSCSKGFAEKTGGYKKNPLGIDLKGCPLDERISEMQFLRKRGDVVAALSMIMLDNPMCPGTGHRICNDCMKGCIFQKQDPVNIPQNETGILTEVLGLPYGVEIYGLLTRWNPLNRRRPYALPYQGKNVLVVGLGPAGYTLSHYLANEGFGVVGIDALKIEPLSQQLLQNPVKNFSSLKHELDERVLTGFGGVSEYGITVRWDKNFLSLIYLTLSRRQNVRFYGGVRFGGTLNVEDAWSLGFSHISLATGAGKPTLVPMKNNMAKGVRKASDFLMSLQLTGAFKKNLLTNLEISLPVIVIGGGLTAFDTATESLAYYPIQVEKISQQFESLAKELGEEQVWGTCTEEEKEKLRTYLAHAKAIREEKAKAQAENRKPDVIALCRQWGGVTVAYRKKLSDSPAYRLNHEEVEKAFEEGIYFYESVTPVEIKTDKYRHVSELVFKKESGESVTLPARSILVAAGTSPNTIYEREFPGTFSFEEKGKYFKTHTIEKSDEGKWQLVAKPSSTRGAFFLSYENQNRLVSFFGDNHPAYAGNVVKAMASAKHGIEEIAKLFDTDALPAKDISEYRSLVAKLDEEIVPRVVSVNRLTPTIVEVIVKGKYAARKFEPGQFYRLQNFETLSPKASGIQLSMESLALTGAWVDKEKDLLSMVVLEMGTSSKLCRMLKPGEPVVVMGPTGAPSEIPSGETVLLAGGGLGNAVLLSISRALRERGSKVIYFAGYRSHTDLFMKSQIEEATDQMIWAVDRGDEITPSRPQDIAYVGNIVQAMVSYAKGELQQPPLFSMNKIDRILAIGSDRMMRAVKEARYGVLKPYLKEGHVAIGSINSPMQCMMKEVCAQCLQRHVDPVTGEENFVFSCFNQDQELDFVDFDNLNDRLKVNAVMEKLSDAYLSQIERHT